MMSDATEREPENRREAARLLRQPENGWQLRIEDDLLITKNITDLSPTGLSFKAPNSSSFEPGQLLRLNLSIGQGESFECFAKIMWVKLPAVRTGVMKQFGAHFINLPEKYNALITREIFESQISERKRSRPNAEETLRTRPPEVCVTARSIAKRIFGYALLSLMATALVSAAWIHKADHPEESLANIFNKALATKLQTKLRPRSAPSE